MARISVPPDSDVLANHQISKDASPNGISSIMPAAALLGLNFVVRRLTDSEAGNDES